MNADDPSLSLEAPDGTHHWEAKTNVIACTLDDRLLPAWAFGVTIAVMLTKSNVLSVSRLAASRETKECLHHLRSLPEEVLTAKDLFLEEASEVSASTLPTRVAGLEVVVVVLEVGKFLFEPADRLGLLRNLCLRTDGWIQGTLILLHNLGKLGTHDEVLDVEAGELRKGVSGGNHSE